MKNKNPPGTPSSKDKWQKFSEEQEQPLAEKAVSDDSAYEDEANLNLEFPNRDTLEGQLTHAEQELNAFKDKNLRLLAQLKNIQERADRDVSNAHKYGSEKLLNDLLPVLDSLERALENCLKGEETEMMREGLQLTLELFMKTLKKHGVEVIAPEVGERFNPERQEAVSVQPDPNAQANTILATIQKGYLLNGRVIRAAMVVVAG